MNYYGTHLHPASNCHQNTEELAAASFCANSSLGLPLWSVRCINVAATCGDPKLVQFILWLISAAIQAYHPQLNPSATVRTSATFLGKMLQKDRKKIVQFITSALEGVVKVSNMPERNAAPQHSPQFSPQLSPRMNLTLTICGINDCESETDNQPQLSPQLSPQVRKKRK